MRSQWQNHRCCALFRYTYGRYTHTRGRAQIPFRTHQMKRVELCENIAHCLRSPCSQPKWVNKATEDTTNLAQRAPPQQTLLSWLHIRSKHIRSRSPLKQIYAPDVSTSPFGPYNKLFKITHHMPKPSKRACGFRGRGTQWSHNACVSFHSSHQSFPIL